MAKQKKNSNYVTDKTSAAKAEREATKAKEQKDKKVKLAVTISATLVGCIAVIIGFLALVGVFNYTPEATNHASVILSNGQSFHIELYGNDAPETVKHFVKLCEDGYFTGKSLHTLTDGLLYCGSENADGGKNGIKGEFTDNGFENKVAMKKGVVAMARGESKDSAYGQFFVLTKNNKGLDGKYAAFGKITDIDVLNELLKDIRVSADGSVENAPTIKSVSFHDAHGH